MTKSASQKPQVPSRGQGDATDSGSDSTHRRIRWTFLLFLIIAAIRLAAASGDLAIDEIWSLLISQTAVQRFVDILAIRHDNNHLLNTMILYGIGSGVPGFCYRLPAVIASVASVWLAARIAFSRGGFPLAAMSAITVGASYLLILYGTEARGYSYAVFFAYLSWWLMIRAEAHGRWIDAIGFAASCCLGFLSHLTFLYCFVGCYVWTAWKTVRKRSWKLIFAHIPPSLMAIWLYLFFIRGMAVGGGPETNLLDAIISTLSIVYGGPAFGGMDLAAAAMTALLMAVGLYLVWKTDKATAAAWLTITILAPAAVLFLTGHALIYPRYFLIPVAFALMLISESLSAWRQSRVGLIVWVVPLAIYLCGNLWWTTRLMDHGRGDYSKAVAWMVEESGDRSSTVSSDHDFRNRLVFEYFASQTGAQSRLTYLPQQAVPASGTEWLIRHNFEGDAPYPDALAGPTGIRYRLQRVFTHHSLTGWNWWVYRRET